VAVGLVIDFLQVRLHAAATSLAELAVFYGQRLGLDHLVGARFQIGATELDFIPSGGESFYHFALLVPGDRFDAAFAWARERVELLPRQDGELVFDFSFWDALACYFQDPAGSIAELIAHRGIGDAGVTGEFSASELLGFSELGLVGDVPRMAHELERLELHVWDGTLDGPDALGFAGEKARTLILCPEGRSWLPIGRLAEPHPVQVTLAGPPAGTAAVGGIHRVSRAA
jgi:hypothetical protein